MMDLDGAKHFQKNCQNVPGAAGAAVGAAAASAVCIYYVIIGGRFAPPNKYMIKCIQQKQQQLQEQLQQQPQQLQGHSGNFFENVWPHLAWPHVAFSEWVSLTQHHSNLSQVWQRQVLIEKYDQICNKVQTWARPIDAWMLRGWMDA